jgi:hypothetical protein
MAVIDTDTKFQDAASVWIAANPGAFSGTPFPNKTERKIYDEQNNPTPPPEKLFIDVTPSQAVLEAALDSFNTEKAQQAEIDEARVAIGLIRTYLQNNLVKLSPDNATTVVTKIKEFANGNTYLARIMTNQVNVMNSAHGWSLTQTPTTAQTRSQYIKTVEIILGVYPLL